MSKHKTRAVMVNKTVLILNNMHYRKGFTIDERIALMEAVHIMRLSQGADRPEYLDCPYDQLHLWVEHYNDGLIYAHEFMGHFLTLDVIPAHMHADTFALVTRELNKLSVGRLVKVGRRLCGQHGLINALCPWTALINMVIQDKAKTQTALLS